MRLLPKFITRSRERIEQVEGPETREPKGRPQSWRKVVCLTSVVYFSTLGYIPGIAAPAA